MRSGPATRSVDARAAKVGCVGATGCATMRRRMRGQEAAAAGGGSPVSTCCGAAACSRCTSTIARVRRRRCRKLRAVHMTVGDVADSVTPHFSSEVFATPLLDC